MQGIADGYKPCQNRPIIEIAWAQVRAYCRLLPPADQLRREADPRKQRPRPDQRRRVTGSQAAF